jgi:2-dehydropantoate 2-reductase
VKICIVGCGALGSVIAAHLARLPEVEVYVYEVSPSQLCAIQQHGGRISGAAEFTVKVNATSNPRDIPCCDFGIFATKSQHTRAAAEQTAHIFSESGAVCSVQMAWAMKKSSRSMATSWFEVRPLWPHI